MGKRRHRSIETSGYVYRKREAGRQDCTVLVMPRVADNKKIKKDCTDLVCHVRRIKVPDLASAELVEDRQEVRHVFDQMVSADAISVHMCTLSCGGPDAKQRGTGC